MLGYRITLRFVHSFLGRIFNNPHAIFTKEMLRPELQDRGMFAEGVECLVATQKRVAEQYLNDGGIDVLCPPWQALIHVMVSGSWEGKDLHHPDVRGMFTREYLLNSAWYKERLKTKQIRDQALWERHVRYLDGFLKQENRNEDIKKLGLEKRLQDARKQLQNVQDIAYLKQLNGTIGADPLTGYQSQMRTERALGAKKS